MDDLKSDLKIQIFTELELYELVGEKINEITFETPLFNNPYLHLDSIDALRIIGLLRKIYNVRIRDISLGEKVLYSITTIAEFVQEQNKIKSNNSNV